MGYEVCEGYARTLGDGRVGAKTKRENGELIALNYSVLNFVN